MSGLSLVLLVVVGWVRGRGRWWSRVVTICVITTITTGWVRYRTTVGVTLIVWVATVTSSRVLPGIGQGCDVPERCAAASSSVECCKWKRLKPITLILRNGQHLWEGGAWGTCRAICRRLNPGPGLKADIRQCSNQDLSKCNASYNVCVQNKPAESPTSTQRGRLRRSKSGVSRSSTLTPQQAWTDLQNDGYTTG